jgi:nucleoid-associated protein YgaU
MRKALFFLILLIIFVSAIIIDRNVRQESKAARYGTTAPEDRDDDILEITIGHPEGLPPEEAGRAVERPAPSDSPPAETRPERTTEPPVQPRPAERPERPQPQDPRGKRHVYVVQEGDTLSGIAKRLLGDESKVHLLIEWNALRNPDQIYPGDRLRYYK